MAFDASTSTRLSPGNFGRLARRTGFTKNHISRVLRGIRKPTFDAAAIIAREAGVTLEELHEWTLQFRKSMVPKALMGLEHDR